MTWELTAAQQAARDRARDFAADSVHGAAAEIDRSGAIPAALLREAAALLSGDDGVAYVAAVEEMGAASASLATAAVVGMKAGSTAGDLSGLRGVATSDRLGSRAHLGLAAVALGLGRAALDRTFDTLRATDSGRGEERPHWVAADAATDLEAARLLTLQAAADGGDGPIAIARLMASAAAAKAVDAAIRIAGVEGVRAGAELERLSRDVRALAVVAGSEEDHRAAAAAALFTTEP